MKFDFAIGNPPYQDETVGEQKKYSPPVYNLFLEEAYKVCNCVELIHPARFLFNAGATPKQWNEKMLNDPHIKVKYYEQNSGAVFCNTDIKGGIAITYRNAEKSGCAIGTFTLYQEMNTVLQKVFATNSKRLNSIVYGRNIYRFTDEMHQQYPKLIDNMSAGHAFDLSSNIFDRIPEVFFDTKPEDGKCYVGIWGRKNNNRALLYIKSEFVRNEDNLEKWKVLISNINGNGIFGETLTEPLLAEPGICSTETFISAGAFKSKFEAEALKKYIKSKFCRALLSTLKITPHNSRDTWKNVPLQDFTSQSDIDWSQSITNIDKQLYKKYGLSQEEINFIESKVKEMA